jgi:rubrerythrin
MDEEEYYIDDNDLVELLKDVLGENISEEDIERILKASGDENISEEDFDNLVDEILASSKIKNDNGAFEDSVTPIDDGSKEFVYLSNSPDRCPVCGGFLLDSNYCPICNLKFSFDTKD